MLARKARSRMYERLARSPCRASTESGISHKPCSCWAAKRCRRSCTAFGAKTLTWSHSERVWPFESGHGLGMHGFNPRRVEPQERGYDGGPWATNTGDQRPLIWEIRGKGKFDRSRSFAQGDALGAPCFAYSTWPCLQKKHHPPRPITLQHLPTLLFPPPARAARAARTRAPFLTPR